jgi:hypothetical protein
MHIFQYQFIIPADDIVNFLWHGRCFQFTCLPQGLCSSPHVFTKLLKPVFAKLREVGHAIVGYIDDTLLVADAKSESWEDIEASASLLDWLGYAMNLLKSVLMPTHIIEFIGFFLMSLAMTVSLPDRKKRKKVKQLCEELLTLTMAHNFSPYFPLILPLNTNFLSRISIQMGSAIMHTAPRGQFWNYSLQISGISVGPTRSA